MRRIWCRKRVWPQNLQTAVFRRRGMMAVGRRGEIQLEVICQLMERRGLTPGGVKE
jgi:hypothetical protein